MDSALQEVAGRYHSATRGAHVSTLVTVTVMAMGQAAALAVQQNVRPQEINGVRVRETLALLETGPYTDA